MYNSLQTNHVGHAILYTTVNQKHLRSLDVLYCCVHTFAIVVAGVASALA